MTEAARDWDHLYAQGDTGWDLREVTPALQTLLGSGFLARLPLTAGCRVAVPGCGLGHDLRAFAQHGCQVTGFDISPLACAQARTLLALNGVAAAVVCRDLFGLLPEFAGCFDLVYDYTCFCAIPRHLRAAYGRIVHGLLVPRGHLLVLAYPMLPERAGQGGPPYLVTEPDLHLAFDAGFTLVESFAPQDSVPRRAAAERWYRWQRR